jgi:hypothetical protein
MRHEQDGGAGFEPDSAQFLIEAVAGNLIERPEGLVHQKQARPAEQRPCDRDALTHAA